jgi:hypothetical protein
VICDLDREVVRRGNEVTDERTASEICTGDLPEKRM